MSPTPPGWQPDGHSAVMMAGASASPRSRPTAMAVVGGRRQWSRGGTTRCADRAWHGATTGSLPHLLPYWLWWRSTGNQFHWPLKPRENLDRRSRHDFRSLLHSHSKQQPLLFASHFYLRQDRVYVVRSVSFIRFVSNSFWEQDYSKSNQPTYWNLTLCLGLPIGRTD